MFRYASRPHYWRHLAAVSSTAVVPMVDFGSRLAQPWATRLLSSVPTADRRGLYLVASIDDARAVAPNDLVYVEHGAGQTYTGQARPNPSYAGGRDAALKRVVLALVPGRSSVERWADAYPGTEVVAVGCPKLVPWVDRPASVDVVGITWHWDCPLVAETRTAFWSYRHHLGLLVDRLRAAGLRVVGHGHPRCPDAVWEAWERLGVEQVRDEADLFDVAGILMADNTSLIYEFAALDRPVVALNAPTYRRDVEHGLRFWSQIPGRAVDGWEAAADAAIGYASDPSIDRDLRADVTRDVYALDPRAGAVGAGMAITRVVSAWG